MLIRTFILAFRSARSSLGHSVEKSNHSKRTKKFYYDPVPNSHIQHFTQRKNHSSSKLRTWQSSRQKKVAEGNNAPSPLRE
jgi:hypothetical protein